jgi:hypothetical protein
MRRFTAEATPTEERLWEVVIGRESWGTLVLLFSPVSGGDVRKSVLVAETMFEAEAELGALTDGELRERLALSSPW